MEIDTKEYITYSTSLCDPNASIPVESISALVNFSRLCGNWPWKHMSNADYDYMTNLHYGLWYFNEVVVPFCRVMLRLLGIVGALAFLSMVRYIREQRQVIFRKCLGAMSCADLLYNTVSIVYTDTIASQSELLKRMRFTCEILLPFFMLLAMVSLTSCIVTRIRYRVKMFRKERKATGDQYVFSGICRSSHEAKLSDEFSKMIVITLITAGTFIRSQVAWLCFEAAQICDVYKRNATLSSTMEEIQAWYRLHVFLTLTSVLCSLFESLDRTSTFYIHMLFNRRARKHFRLSLKQCVTHYCGIHNAKFPVF
ncbi:unnamed protein product [Soboliphyme baturini]|uniref:G_PROTEIN_RECEP_F1_2 domain-containing protein n=1 Tax=Soboliphyme baturini TaxID=241478 RepID=A0A183IUV6_9BILA|nr:unnamed protein product [Soboliphyme baturini]